MTNTGGTAVTGYDYYPFGKELRSSITSGADSRFMFQGKEFDTALSLDLYYFEARFYRPDIGRFASPDPERVRWSYYSFCNNNPLRYVDPTGLEPIEVSEDEDNFIEACGFIGLCAGFAYSSKMLVAAGASQFWTAWGTLAGGVIGGIAGVTLGIGLVLLFRWLF